VYGLELYKMNLIQAVVQEEDDIASKAALKQVRLFTNRPFIHVVPSVYSRGTVRLFTCYQFSMSVYYRGINLELLGARGG
jgi:hypothetical protein